LKDGKEQGAEIKGEIPNYTLETGSGPLKVCVTGTEVTDKEWKCHLRAMMESYEVLSVANKGNSLVRQ
jgi:hypothetical protein